MKITKKPGPVKIITGLIFNDPEILDRAVVHLTRRFGPVDSESDIFLFNHTRYYNKEMGEDLKRRFLSFKKLIHSKDAYRLKLFTKGIEKILSVSGKRRINIDPGYLSLGKLVLLSTKDYSHRIYVNKGIYAEVTLAFNDRSYRPWGWTYPDYKTEGYIDFFNRVRRVYLTSLRGAPRFRGGRGARNNDRKR